MRSICRAALLAALALPAAVCAQPAAQATSGRTADLQGDPRGFMSNPNVRAFYELSVATLRPGAPKLDVKAYEEKSFALFRAMGPAMGTTPEAMQDHLKLIPRQVIQIVREDPRVLDSFEAFTEALVGPK